MNKVPMKLKIIQKGLELFLEKGFTNTTATEIAKSLNISKGNLTFHSPTKEDLLLELIEELCTFQANLINHYVEEGERSLFAYCMELAAMAWVCETYPKAKDIYLATYRHDKTLKLIREYDTNKLERIFQQYNPNWKYNDFKNAEYLISGLEYAMLCSSNDETFPIETRITNTLKLIMETLNVDKEEIEIKLNRVLNTDCKSLGENVLKEFIEYVDKVNLEAINNEILNRKK